MRKILVYIICLIFIPCFGQAQQIINGSGDLTKSIDCRAREDIASYNKDNPKCNIFPTGPLNIALILGTGSCFPTNGFTSDTIQPYPDGRYSFILATNWQGYSLQTYGLPSVAFNLGLSNLLNAKEKYFIVYYALTLDTTHKWLNPNNGQFIQELHLYDSILIGGSVSLGTFTDTIAIQFPRIGQWARYHSFYTPSTDINYISIRNYNVDRGLFGVNFVDFVQLFHLDTVKKFQISLCKNDSIQLLAGKPGFRYEWSKFGVEYVTVPKSKAGIYKTNLNGDTKDYIYAKDTGWYWNITYLTDSTISIDSFYAYYGGTEFNQPKEMNYCLGDTFILQTPNRNIANPSWLWNTGQTNYGILLFDSGKFWVKTTVPSCVYLDTFIVHLKGESLKLNIPDTSFCTGTAIKLDASNKGFNLFKWNTGDTTSQINISTAGKYWLKASDGICSVSDTISISEYSGTALSLPIDTTFCKGGFCALSAANPVLKLYRWSTGDTIPVITITNAGKYTIIATDTSGCKSYDTILVYEIPPPALHIPQDTIVCPGVNVTIDATDSFYGSYHWNTGAQTAEVKLIRPGLYFVYATNDNCKTADSISLRNYFKPNLQLTSDTVICFDDIEGVILDAGKFKSYYWYPTGETTESIEARKAEQYVVVVTDTNNCVNWDTTLVEEKCGQKMYIPNSFTPNGDGVNDEFMVHARNPESFDLHIYNRWGQIIFRSTEITQGWDGRYKNMDCQEGVYNYLLTVRLKNTDSMQTVKGTLTLLR